MRPVHLGRARRDVKRPGGRVLVADCDVAGGVDLDEGVVAHDVLSVGVGGAAEHRPVVDDSGADGWSMPFGTRMYCRASVVPLT